MFGDKKSLSETEIRTRYITPSLVNAGWSYDNIHEEKSFTDGRVIDKGHGEYSRGERKRTDYLLTYNSSYIAIVEAKDNNHPIGYGMQQAIDYAEMLDVPFAFSSNGDGYIKKNMITKEEVEIGLDEFPSPEDMWKEYITCSGISEEQERIIKEPLYPSKYAPRYYQQIAIERTLKAVANGQDRVLLVMATGTGKTYTAFQIIYRLWKSRTKKRILFLADRNILIDQTMVNDFAPFKGVMTKIKGKYDPAYEVYLGLYQQLKGSDGRPDLYKTFPSDFFDLIVVDECHRGSAAEDSSWREVLSYFGSATQVGLTATPKNEKTIQNYEYFGEPVYTYSLKQGIEDGFLAPYRVLRVGLDKDIEDIIVKKGTLNTDGDEVDEGVYGGTDINKKLVLPERDKLVAKIITDYMKETNRRMDKTIIFCVDEEHADRMRRELINQNLDMVEKDDRYIMRITGSDGIGKMQLDNFINPRKKYPTIVTTSKLLTTGVDAKTCKFIVIDTNIKSMVEFKQIIGRGTRISEEFDKYAFTIIDFTGATELFKDPKFDGEVEITPVILVDPPVVIPGQKPEPKIPVEPGQVIPATKHKRKPKIVLPNERVAELYRQQKLIDEHGNLITENFTQFVKNKITDEFSTYSLFKQYWDSEEMKENIIKALEEKDIYLNILEEEVGEEYDPFDLLVHVAYGKKPLTRSQRARKVKQSEYFDKYSEQAKEVLSIILDKYVDGGIEELENPNILNIPELSAFGTIMEIIMTIFMGLQNFQKALEDMKSNLYSLEA